MQNQHSIGSPTLCGVIIVIIASDRYRFARMLRTQFVGHGTERLEEALGGGFPDVPIIRVDRDTTSRRRAFEQLIQPVIDGQPCILVGTNARQRTQFSKALHRCCY